MAEGKKSFTAYCDWGEVVDKMTDEQAGKLMKHLFDYVRDKNPSTDDLLIDVAFTPIKSTLKRDLVKWEEKCSINKENGQKGGRPKNPKKPNGYLENPIKAKKPDNDSVNVSESVNESEKDSFYNKELFEIEAVTVFDMDGIYKVDALADNYIKDDRVVNAVISNKDNGFKDVAHLKKMMLEFKKELLENGETVKMCREFNRHFRNWHKKKTNISKNTVGGLKLVNGKMNVI